MRIDVLSEQGRDPPVDYRAGAGAPEAAVHPPVNYWAYAAATGGRFCQRVEDLDDGADAVVVLLRQRNSHSLSALQRLRERGRRVFVSWKETGLHQIRQQTAWPWQRAALRKCFALAHGAVAATEGSVDHYRRHGGAAFPVHFIPTPYPVDLPSWDFSRPLAERRGIFIGTRQFDVPSRRHAEALTLAARVAAASGCPVTVLNSDGVRASRQVRRLLQGAPEVNLVEQRLSYPDYLRLMAQHRVVLQRDASNVPGQVAGDALLCRVINVGGDGTVQRIAFPEFSSINDDEAALAASLERLLRDDAVYAAALADAQARAARELSYAAGREKLRALLR